MTAEKLAKNILRQKSRHHTKHKGGVDQNIDHTHHHCQGPFPGGADADGVGPKRGGSGMLLVVFGNLGGSCCSCQVVFPPSRRGKCCLFFHFVFFHAWLGVFCRFFPALLFLGSLFGKIFGSELLVLGLGVGCVYSGAVLPMLLLYYLVCRSRKCLEKILFWSGPLFE